MTDAGGTIRDWTPDQLGDQDGKCFVITGGNSGIGLEAAKILAARNADIVIACRSLEKAKEAAAEIAPLGNGMVDMVALDLADLSSIRTAAGAIAEKCPKIDALINNAGVMQTPKRKTADGFELQLGTNHLGHFLLTGLLRDQVEAAAGRFVIVSSIAHKAGKIHFGNLMLEQGYAPMKAYTQSKLANLLFANALRRRLEASNSPAQVMACHPGYSHTNLQFAGPQGLWKLVYPLANAILAQSAERGAYPTVLAAAGQEAVSGGYYGPTGFGDTRGPVGDAEMLPRARDEEVAEQLWRESEELTGLQWP